jgi:hypothetical protein
MLQSIIRKTIVSENGKYINKIIRAISAATTVTRNLNTENVVRAAYNIDIPDMTLTQYVFRDVGCWKDKPAMVCL